MLAKILSRRLWVVLGFTGAAALLCSKALFIYGTSGYSETVFLYWMYSIVTGATAALAMTKGRERWRLGFTRYDIVALVGLLLIGIPLYFFGLYYIPYQLNTDEPTIMHFTRAFTLTASPDPFGLTNYFEYPALIFVVFGSIADALGGIDLYHFRVVHAISALLIIGWSYLLLRTAVLAARMRGLSAYALPFAGAVLVASNHALLAVSRMAMRDNSALLVEVVSMTLLGIGLMRKNWFMLFLGGAALGFSFYVYLPARIIIVFWLALLGGAWLFFEKEYRPKEILLALMVSCFAAFLVVAPLIATLLAAERTEITDVSNKFLLSEEGRLEQQAWVGAATIAEGLRINTMQGLTMFNNNLHDHNYVYPNYGHGFVDPLTGLLIWIGLASVLVRWARGRETSELHLWLAGCFVMLWLVLSFFFNKNPHYNRLLSTLPFVAFLVIEALRALGALATQVVRRIFGSAPMFSHAFVALGVIVIMIWNLSIFTDFMEKGLGEGDALGATARYTEGHSDLIGHTFYLAANAAHPYYTWGIESQWQGWLGTFVSKHQKSFVIDPSTIQYGQLSAPFTIFMNKTAWDQHESTLRARFPGGTIISMTPNGSRVAYEFWGRIE